MAEKLTPRERDPEQFKRRLARRIVRECDRLLAEQDRLLERWRRAALEAEEPRT